MVPFIDDGSPAAAIYADAFYQPGETRRKAGHFPAEVSIRPGTRGRNGWGYVVRLGEAVFYDCGTAPAEFLELFASRRAFIYILDTLAQGPGAGHRQRRRPVGPHKGIRAVNGILASFWSTAALCEWLPGFRRVPSKPNVSDAVSKPPAQA